MAPRPASQPTLCTERLILRPFVEEEASRLAALAGTFRVADTTGSIPHPYSPEQALADIRRFHAEFQSGAAAHFTINLREQPDQLIGHVLLKEIEAKNCQAELGYWIDEAASGKGYVTEAAREALRFAFGVLNLNRICAHAVVRNESSARVLHRLGFHHEGILRQRIQKWGIFEDVHAWSLLRGDPEAAPYLPDPR